MQAVRSGRSQAGPRREGAGEAVGPKPLTGTSETLRQRSSRQQRMGPKGETPVDVSAPDTDWAETERTSESEPGLSRCP